MTDDLLISEEAIKFREGFLSNLWEVVTAEAIRIAKEEGERTVSESHIKEAIKRQAKEFRSEVPQPYKP